MNKNRVIKSFLVFLFVGVLFVSSASPTLASALNCFCFNQINGCVGTTLSEETSCEPACQTAYGAELGMFRYANEGDGGYEEIYNACRTVNTSFSKTAAAAATTTEESVAPIIPTLNVDIPGLEFEVPEFIGNAVYSNFIGDYLIAFYTWLLYGGFLAATLIIMVAGVQYLIGAGVGQVDRAKKMIQGAIIGSVMLAGTSVILNYVNPTITTFEPIGLETIEQLELELSLMGTGGLFVFEGGIDRAACQSIYNQAQSNATCAVPGGFQSPSGSSTPGCGYHHWADGNPPAAGDYTKIKNLDYSASWGSPIYAPIDGTVSYVQQAPGTTDPNRCGNTIYIRGSDGTKVTICHAKDFLDENNTYRGGRGVSKGEVIGHTGGKCCENSVPAPPSNWSQAHRCTVKASPKCTSPITHEPGCTCQPPEQSGNTSGPHIHMGWSSSSLLLSCVESGVTF